MKRATIVRLAVVLALGLTGCVTTPEYAAPGCEASKNTLVLMAQSVPDAELIPCIEAMPAGWMIRSTEIKSGGVRTVFGDASGGPYVVQMDFVAACDIGDAVEVPSDEEGATRYEDIEDVDEGYRGDRYYTFEGGCVHYRFELGGEGWSAVVNDAAAATTFASRESLSEYVRANTRGVVEEL